MKTTTTFLVMLLFAVMTCATASADTLIVGFENGDDSFNQASDGASLSLGTTGATEGTMALQLTSDGGFEFTQGFGFFAALTDPTNDTIKFDVLFTPDDPTTVNFSQVQFGINSDGSTPGFQFGPTAFAVTPGTSTAVELNFSDLPQFPLDGNETFAGLILITNTDEGAGSGVWSFDNIRLHTIAVPEPSSLALIGGLGMLGLLRRKK